MGWLAVRVVSRVSFFGLFDANGVAELSRPADSIGGPTQQFIIMGPYAERGWFPAWRELTDCLL